MGEFLSYSHCQGEVLYKPQRPAPQRDADQEPSLCTTVEIPYTTWPEELLGSNRTQKLLRLILRKLRIARILHPSAQL